VHVLSRRRLSFVALLLLALAGCGDEEPASVSSRTTTVVRTVTVPATTPTTATTPVEEPAPDPGAPLTLRAAEHVLDARGYATLTARDFRPDQPLKVLIGIRREAPRAELAFFFVGDRYIGTDTKDPSARIEVVAQRDDAITLAYALYRPGDATDAPSGGTAEVTYRWTGGSLEPQDPIPAADPAADPSRR
jgi:hypothetical protein